MPKAPDRANRQPVERTSAPLLEEHVANLRRLFPEAVSEGKIDFDKLRATLGDFVETRPERFSFTWAGKQDAIALLQTPSRATLIPCPEESVNFDSTQNLFIEGDNLEVLKLLFKPYFGRVKMIYLDPPYNTGQDFVYPDNYADPLASYMQFTGQVDSAGNLLTSNPETSGRYHSAWLSMMYPRLFLARQLLTEAGAIFVSIDDHEVHHLRMLMNEVFGEENFVATFIWEKRTTRENRRVFSFNHDFIVCYAQNSDEFQQSRGMLPITEEVKKRYGNPDNDPRGEWQSVSLAAQAGHATPAQFYTIVTPSDRELSPPPGNCWRVTEKRLKELIADNRIWFGTHGNNVPRMKVFLSDANEGLTPHTLWKAEEVGTNDSAKKSLVALFGGEAVFETPKPVDLIKRMAQISTKPNDEDFVLDFFAGSCTTAQAVLELNREDAGNRKFLMVQLPEPTGKDDYKTIADIGKERIRRVIAKLTEAGKDELPLKTPEADATGSPRCEDLGFKVFKLAPSNYEPWTGVAERDPETYIRQMGLFTDPLVKGWKPVNVIWEAALKEGYGLNSRIEKVDTGQANTVYRVTDPDKGQTFRICLDDEIRPDLDAALKLSADDLFICRDKALDDTAAANLALQCRLKTL